VDDQERSKEIKVKPTKKVFQENVSGVAAALRTEEVANETAPS
jgi:hypothetical protein